LVNKITLSLQKALIAYETEFTTYQSLTKYLIGLNQRQRYLREKENLFSNRRRAATIVSTAAPIPVASTSAVTGGTLVRSSA